MQAVPFGWRARPANAPHVMPRRPTPVSISSCFPVPVCACSDVKRSSLSPSQLCQQLPLFHSSIRAGFLPFLSASDAATASTRLCQPLPVTRATRSKADATADATAALALISKDRVRRTVLAILRSRSSRFKFPSQKPGSLSLSLSPSHCLSFPASFSLFSVSLPRDGSSANGSAD